MHPARAGSDAGSGRDAAVSAALPRSRQPFAAPAAGVLGTRPTSEHSVAGVPGDEGVDDALGAPGSAATPPLASSCPMDIPLNSAVLRGRRPSAAVAAAPGAGSHESDSMHAISEGQESGEGDESGGIAEEDEEYELSEVTRTSTARSSSSPPLSWERDGSTHVLELDSAARMHEASGRGDERAKRHRAGRKRANSGGGEADVDDDRQEEEAEGIFLTEEQVRQHESATGAASALASSLPPSSSASALLRRRPTDNISSIRSKFLEHVAASRASRKDGAVEAIYPSDEDFSLPV